MLLLLLACKKDDPVAAAVDVSERLGPGEVRAGRIESAAATFGGISAEGAVGDFKIYNDRVQFIVEAVGDSNYYFEYGGGLIDADVVRPEDEAGRDMLDEMGVMVGFGRTVDATSVSAPEDGSQGTARVRVEGVAAPLQLVTGALEAPDLVPELDLAVVTDYELEADAWSMRVTTTVTNHEDEDVSIDVGDGALVALDVAEGWQPGLGLEGPGEDPMDWAGLVGQRNEGAFALLSDDEAFTAGALGAALGSSFPMVVAFAPTVTIAPGGSTTWVRWMGAAPDLATLSGEQLERRGDASQELSGTVLAGGEAVAGARVTVVDGAGDPVTLAFTAEDGSWSARVPEGETQIVTSGRGHGLVMDLPAGHAWYSPYAADSSFALASLASGGPVAPFAEGYGVGSGDLVAPGVVRVRVADGGPAVAHVRFTTEDTVVVDERIVPGRPNGAMALGFVRDGELDVPVEPGTYEVVVGRGVRDEVWSETVTVASGETVEVVAEVVPAYTLEGVITGDPHTHASPSSDAGVAMEERMLAMAVNGIDVHFGTDHDHIADYRPLIAPLGLEGRLVSIVAEEVSPVLRGHFNAYPAEEGEGPNHGAPLWWLGYDDTTEIFGWIRALVGEDGVIQANHPVGDSGLFSFASWDLASGLIRSPEAWSDDFDAVEVLNSGDYIEVVPYYLDLVSRGMRVTPVGVSDSHTATSGGLGLNLTFYLTGGDLASFDEAVLLDTMARGATVVSHGPYIDARVGDEAAPGATFEGSVTLDVTVYAPSWMPVETVSLYEDGVAVATEACAGTAPTPCTASWPLTPEADASYVVFAESTVTAMTGVHAGNLAWAMTAGSFIDVAGDGWEAPLPPLTTGAR